MTEIFKVERKEHITMITNYSDMNLWVFQTPLPPKRKHVCLHLIQPEQFVIWDFPVDLTRINFRLEKIREEE
jgi:hypothetical protein